MTIVGVNVSVADAARFDSAIAEAETLGLKIEGLFADRGTASGLIEGDKLDGLRKVAGLAVEGDAVIPEIVNEHAHGHAADEETDK